MHIINYDAFENNISDFGLVCKILLAVLAEFGAVLYADHVRFANPTHRNPSAQCSRCAINGVWLSIISCIVIPLSEALWHTMV